MNVPSAALIEAVATPRSSVRGDVPVQGTNDEHTDSTCRFTHVSSPVRPAKRHRFGWRSRDRYHHRICHERRVLVGHPPRGSISGSASGTVGDLSAVRFGSALRGFLCSLGGPPRRFGLGYRNHFRTLAGRWLTEPVQPSCGFLCSGSCAPRGLCGWRTAPRGSRVGTSHPLCSGLCGIWRGRPVPCPLSEVLRHVYRRPARRPVNLSVLVPNGFLEAGRASRQHEAPHLNTEGHETVEERKHHRGGT